MAAKIRAAKTKAMNAAPTIVWETMNDCSEFNVAVEGNPPKYAVKNIATKMAPTPWAVNKNVLICFWFSFT